MENKTLESLGFEDLFDDIIATEGAIGSTAKLAVKIAFTIGKGIIALPLLALAVGTLDIVVVLSSINKAVKDYTKLGKPAEYSLYDVMKLNSKNITNIKYPKGITKITKLCGDFVKLLPRFEEYKKLWESTNDDNFDGNLVKIKKNVSELTSECNNIISSINKEINRLDDENCYEFSSINDANDILKILEYKKEADKLGDIEAVVDSPNESINTKLHSKVNITIFENSFYAFYDALDAVFQHVFITIKK